MRKNPAGFFLVSDHFKTQEMCNDALDVDPWQLNDVPDYLKTQRMCGHAVQRDSYSLQFVFDWFVTQEQLDIWHNDDDYCTDDEVIEWHNGYKRRKAQ